MRRRLLLAALVVAVAAFLGGGSRGGDDLRAGSTEEEGPAVELERAPVAYRVDYRVVGRGGGDEVVTSERLWVRRPFESRLETYDGDEPGGEVASVQVSAFGRLLADSRDSAPAVLTRPPGPGASDVRLDGVVGEGVLERRERRRVAGRPCQVLRSGAPLTTGAVTAPSPTEHTDTCVDAAGIVLEEVLVVDGELLLRRVALDVEEDPEVDDGLFEVGEPTVPVDRGGGAVQELTADSRLPDAFWDLAEVPAAFEHRGRYAVVEPHADDPNDPGAEQRRRTYVADVLVDGVDVVVVEQGSTQGGTDPFPGDDPDRTVDLGALGEGQVVLGTQGSEVRAVFAGGRFVRVRGTLPPDVLAAVARALREGPGGELTPVRRSAG